MTESVANAVYVIGLIAHTCVEATVRYAVELGYEVTVAVPIMQWLVPSIEFSGGRVLIIGLLSALAAFGLFLICLGAFALDAIKRIRAWQPIDRADWLGDLLYLPEVLYCIGLAVVMLAGQDRGALTP